MKIYYNCVMPPGTFVYGIHKPSYPVANLRGKAKIEALGFFQDDTAHLNRDNFPEGDLQVEGANWIFEVPNPLPFRGTTFIDKYWADICATDLSQIALAEPDHLSFKQLLKAQSIDGDFLSALPRPLLLTLATCSTDPDDLLRLAALCCEFVVDRSGNRGLRYRKLSDGRIRADIFDHDLFEAVANNPALPDDYKRAMVLRPGAQGASEIIGEWSIDGKSHIFEYLRGNSYIAGGHFAANMADDAVRYSIGSLTELDMQGLRHLYYQRLYVRLAELLGLENEKKSRYSEEDLEELRLTLLHKIDSEDCRNFSTLWGWNFGFDYSPTDYRLHASHQQIHQQYALIPDLIESYSGDPENPMGTMPSFSCGDMVTRVIEEYFHHRHSDFFADYYAAIAGNVRMDRRSELPSSLIVWQDDNVLVFVPKAQTSQWELQIMTKPNVDGLFPGNILETDSACRNSLNIAILKSQQVLEKLGARLVTSIEYSKRIAERGRFNQPLLYAILPKLPFAPGAFSEAQLRFISRQYPEDFAAVCRNQL
jgi:hypothetical protein